MIKLKNAFIMFKIKDDISKLCNIKLYIFNKINIKTGTTKK